MKKNGKTEDRPLRVKGDPTVLVRLSEVAEPKRTELENQMLAAIRKARELQKIRGTGGHTDAGAVMGEGEAYGGGMKRGKDAPVPLPKKMRKIHPEVVAAEEADTTASDGTMDDGRAEMGQFVPGPDRETVDVGGVPTSRRRR